MGCKKLKPVTLTGAHSHGFGQACVKCTLLIASAAGAAELVPLRDSRDVAPKGIVAEYRPEQHSSLSDMWL